MVETLKKLPHFKNMPHVMISVGGLVKKLEIETVGDCEKHYRAIQKELLNGARSSSGVNMPLIKIKQLSNTVTIEHLQQLLSKADPAEAVEIAKKEKRQLEEIQKCKETVDAVAEEMDVVRGW